MKLALRPSLATELARLEPRAVELELGLHPGDAMFRFALAESDGVVDMATLDYLRSGYLAFRATQQILRAAFDDGWPAVRLLDFGAGHGRLTRWLRLALPAKQIWSTEIDPSAPDFLSESFGVQIAPAQVRAADFRPGRCFDAVLAFSVLSHLPEAGFESWLRRFYDLLEPGGVMVFSTLDECALLPGRKMNAHGFHFEAVSESDVLEKNAYGTAWMRADFVHEALARLLPEKPAEVVRLPLGIWHLQDLWVVQKPGRPPLDLDFVTSPLGFLETCEASASRLVIGGWAYAGWPPRLATIEVKLDQQTSWHQPTAQRPDLAFTAARTLPTAFEIEIPAASLEQSLAISALDQTTGERFLIHAGTVAETSLFLKLRNATSKLRKARAEIEIFEASRFGRARKAWMNLKDRIRS